MNKTGQASRHMLIEAFISLMEKEDYEQITITQICQEADLSRRTFYRHYRHKKDLLEDHFSDLMGTYLEALSTESPLTMTDITRIFLSFWISHRNTLEVLVKNHLSHLILEEMNTQIGHIHHTIRVEDSNNPLLAYALSFSVGGHFNLLISLIQSHEEISIDMINAIANGWHDML